MVRDDALILARADALRDEAKTRNRGICDRASGPGPRQDRSARAGWSFHAAVQKCSVGKRRNPADSGGFPPKRRRIGKMFC